MTNNLLLALTHLLTALNNEPNFEKRHSLYNSFLLLINSGVNPGFAGEVVQIKEEDYQNIDSNAELLSKMKDIHTSLLNEEQKKKNVKMPLLSKIFRSPYAKKDVAAAGLLIYYSKDYESFKVILQENIRRKGELCYSAAGFENTPFLIQEEKLLRIETIPMS